MAQLVQMRSMGIVQLLLFMYPRLIAISPGRPILAMTRRSLHAADLFVLHTWRMIFVIARCEIAADILRDAFGVAAFTDLPVELPTLETELNKELHCIIQDCWNFTGTYIAVELVREGSEAEAAMTELFVDDSTACGSDLQRWMAQFGVVG
jgi:hypothetical protein